MVKQTSVLGFDLILLLVTIFLMITGVIFIYSSGVTATGETYSGEYIKQIVWVATGLVILLAFSLINYSRLAGLSIFIYGACLALLVITLLFGRVVNGARSWLGNGDLGVQPSEFAKVGTILLLASYLSGIGERRA